MTIDYIPGTTSNLVGDPSEGGAFSSGNKQELSSANTAAANAATSATAASASATAANLSKESATSSESNAQSYKTLAETAAATATVKAVEASVSAVSAAASYDSFDDRYLGSKTSEPTVDNDGNALLVGAMYFNSTSNLMKVYNGSAWQITAVDSTTILLKAQNLADLPSVSTARTNLGLGTMALETAADYAELAGATFTGDVTAPEFIGVLQGETVFKAKAGEALVKGDAVYVSGVSGNTPVVSKADANGTNTFPAFGLANADTALNNNVDIVTAGQLKNIDTSGFALGDTLYLSTTPGALTATPPTGEGSVIQNMGKVEREHASVGSILVVGAGRTAATPNLNQNNIFIGNASNKAVTQNIGTALSGATVPTLDINGGTIDGVTIGASSVAGNLSFADNTKAIFGNDGNELALYHNTTDSIIEDQGTGSLFIKGTQLKLQSAAGEDYATFTNNGPARLFNNGVEKIATSSTGATVTGRLNTGQIEVSTLRANDGTAAGSIADSTGVTTLSSAVLTSAVLTTADINGGTIDGTVIGGSTAAAGTFTSIGSGDITITDGTPALTFVDSDGTNQKTEQLQAGGSFVTTVRNNNSHGSIDFKSNNGSTNKLRLRIGTNGDFNHYLDDGTTLGMKFDSSSGRLGIGSNTSPGAAIDVEGNVLVRHFNPSLTLNDTDGDQECVISCNGNAAFITSTADNGAYGEIAFRRSDGSTTKNFVRFEDNGHVNFFKDDGGNAMRLTGNAGSLGIGVTSPTEKLHVSGNIKAEGIVFDTETQGTGTSVASNTLEDYERGTFTPTLYDKNATDGNQAVVGTPVGSYTKVGDLVHCTINLSNINVSANSMVSGQQLHIHGLPFTSTTSRLVPIPVYTVQFDVGSPIVGVFGIFGGNGNFIQLRTVFEGGGTAALDVSSVNSTSADLHVAFTYQTSE